MLTSKRLARLSSANDLVGRAAQGVARSKAPLTEKQLRVLERMFYHAHKVNLAAINDDEVEMDLALERAERFAAQAISAFGGTAPAANTVVPAGERQDSRIEATAEFLPDPATRV